MNDQKRSFEQAALRQGLDDAERILRNSDGSRYVLDATGRTVQ